MRLLWVVLVFLGGSGLLIYLASLIIIPNNPDQSIPENKESMIKDKPLFWGSLLIVIGAFLILKQLGLFYSFRFWNIPWQSIWAIILIIAGGALIFNRSKSGEEGAEEKSEDKKLYRSRVQKMVGGVCGGIAEYLNTDPTIVRLIWALLTIVSGFFLGIILYLVAWIIIPEAK